MALDRAETETRLRRATVSACGEFPSRIPLQFCTQRVQVHTSRPLRLTLPRLNSEIAYGRIREQWTVVDRGGGVPRFRLNSNFARHFEGA
jgi:hypothetical protein